MNALAPVPGYAFDAALRVVVGHLLESSLVGTLMLILIAVCHRTSANLRKTLGWIGLAAFAVPAGILSPAFALMGRLISMALRGQAGPMPYGIPGIGLIRLGDAGRGLLPIWLVVLVLGVWAAVTCLILARLVLAYRSLRSTALPGADREARRLFDAFAATAERVGLQPACVRFCVTESDGPAIKGILRPVIVIPRNLQATLSDAEFESIVLHELIHLKRRDHLWGVLRSVLLAAYWPNPVVWLLSRSLALETERACDESVIHLTGRPKDYASGILKTVRLSIGLHDAGLTGVALHSVSARVASILAPQPKYDTPIMKKTIVALACTVAVLCAYAQDTRASAPQSTASASPENTYDISKLSEFPKVLQQVRPVYPPDAHNKGVQGEALVDFIIDPRGNTTHAYAVRATTPEFGKSAVESVAQWKFTPGKVAGKAVFTHMQVPIVYTLEDQASKPTS